MKHLNDYKNFLNEDKKSDVSLDEYITHFLNKKFKFQYCEIVWKSGGGNYKEIDTADFVFKSANIEPRVDWKSDKVVGVYLIINLIDRYGDELQVYFDTTSPTTNKVDLEYAKPWETNYETILVGNHRNRKDKTKGDRVQLVPVEYKTTEMLEELKSILEELNDQIKND